MQHLEPRAANPLLRALADVLLDIRARRQAGVLAVRHVPSADAQPDVIHLTEESHSEDR